MRTRTIVPTSSARSCIERHPLKTYESLARETWSGTSRYDAPDAPLVSFSLGSARATVTRGPFPSFFPLLRCPF